MRFLRGLPFFRPRRRQTGILPIDGRTDPDRGVPFTIILTAAIILLVTSAMIGSGQFTLAVAGFALGLATGKALA